MPLVRFRNRRERSVLVASIIKLFVKMTLRFQNGQPLMEASKCLNYSTTTHTAEGFVDTKEPGIRLKSQELCWACLWVLFIAALSLSSQRKPTGCLLWLPNLPLPLLQQLAQDGLRSFPVCRLQPYLGAGSWVSASDSSAVRSVQWQQRARGLGCVSWRGQKAPKTRKGNKEKNTQ